MTPTELLVQLREEGVHVPPSRMLRAATVARILARNVRTLNEWRHSGTGPLATRLNGQWFYSIESLAAYLHGDGWTNPAEPGDVGVATKHQRR